MKKGVVIICSLLLVVFLSVGFVSANWFTDFFGKITGHVIEGPTNGLIAYYPLDGNANDYSGSGNNGVWSGTESYDAGVDGQAASFDGSSAIVSQNNLGITGNDLRTISYWTYETSSEFIIPWGYGGKDTYDDDYLVNNYGGTSGKGICLAVWGGMGSCSQKDMPLDGWYLVTETFDGSTRRLYVNSSLVASDSTTFSTTDTPLSIGFLYGYDQYGQRGAIDDFRVYNRALSVSEINELYTLGGGIIVCTPSWSAWGSCNATCGGGIQTKTDGCGNTQTQACNIQACTSPTCTNFTYSDWNTCNSSGIQTHTVISTVPAVCVNGNPVLSQTCIYVEPVLNQTNQTTCVANSTCNFVPLVCPDTGKQTKTCAAVNSDCITSVSSEEVSCTSGKCYGCTYLGKCVDHGFRITESGIARYCNTNDEFTAQKSDNSTCQNNYECISNQCSDSTCVSLIKEIREQKNLLVRIICWLSHPTDSIARDECVTTFG